MIKNETQTLSHRMTITEVADLVGICPKTIIRWENVGKVRKAKRDWRGWRVYDDTDVDDIKRFHDRVFEV